MAEAMGPLARTKARRRYRTFNVLNAFSFTILNGSILTLYALSMGADDLFIGLLGAVQFSSFFFMPLGKIVARNRRIIDVYGWGWVARYLGMIPSLAAPFAFMAGQAWLALGLVFAGNVLFNFFRGVGMIGNNPVLSHVAQGKDRGKFIVSTSITGNIVGMLTGLVAALVLGRGASSQAYGLLLLLGMAGGLAGSFIVLGIPDPGKGKGDSGRGFIRALKEAFSDGKYRLFLLVLCLLFFAAGLARPFLALWYKDAYGLNDSLVVALGVAGGLGSLAVGLLARLAVDRVGPKPLLFVAMAAALAGCVPLALSPAFASFAPLLVFLAFATFVFNFGFTGCDSVINTYFYSFVEEGKMIDDAIIYFYALGLSGALGSTLGGFALGALKGAVGVTGAFRIYFAFAALPVLVAAIAGLRLRKLGAFTVREALSIVLSPRELHAMVLLDRLDKSTTPDDERHIIRRIARSASTVSERDLRERIGSPLLETRSVALRALEYMPSISGKTEESLMREVSTHAYTTAYQAARILGNSGGDRCLPVLRAAIASEDYMLAGEAVLALGKLGDLDSLGAIAGRLASERNPRLSIMCACSLERLVTAGMDCAAQAPSAALALSSILERLALDANPADYLRDELVVAASGILGIRDRFYPLYRDYLVDLSKAKVLLLEYCARSGREDTRREDTRREDTRREDAFDDDSARAAIASAFARVDEQGNTGDCLPLAGLVREGCRPGGGESKPLGGEGLALADPGTAAKGAGFPPDDRLCLFNAILADSLARDSLARFPRFRFLCCAWLLFRPGR